MKTLDVRKKKADSGKIGLVKLKGQIQEVLPANQKLLLEGFLCATSSKVCSMGTTNNQLTLPTNCVICP
jgi:hypothetical protein